METLTNIFNAISNALWGSISLYVLIGVGIFFTVALKFPQIRRIGDGFKLMFGSTGGKKADDSGMSSWQSLATAVAGQVGTGNIAGPATAIMSGGPGAVFWVWIAAFLGQATIFAEAVAARHFREELPDGSVNGGPAYYIKAAFPNKFGTGLANTFSVLFLFAFALATSLIQGNTIADVMRSSYNVPTWISGVIVACILLLVVVGGVSRIASVVSTMVPIMAVIYIIMSIILLVVYGSHLGEAFVAIFKYAFTPEATFGGITGITVRAAMRYGVARGLFSNEAGEGTTPHAHAMARVKHPCDQGIVAMCSVVIDSFIILTLSSLIILSSGAYNSGEPGIGVIGSVFSNVFGGFGSFVLCLCIFMFCFSTILAGYFYGIQNVRRLFGDHGKWIYIAAASGLCVFGAVAPVPFVWAFCDAGTGLMTLINLLGLLGVSPVIFKLWKEYEQGGTTLDTSLNDLRRRKAEEKAAKAK